MTMTSSLPQKSLADQIVFLSAPGRKRPRKGGGEDPKYVFAELASNLIGGTSSAPSKRPKGDAISENDGNSAPDKDVAKPTVTKELMDNDDIQRYLALKKQSQSELDALTKQRELILKRQVRVWESYMYGLGKISRLNDVGSAPDAIMPGNFSAVEETTKAANKSKKKK